MRKIFGVALTFALLTAGQASAATLTFIGSDVGNGDIANDPLGPGEHPSSDGARDSWLGYLLNVHTETFESFVAGVSTPLDLSGSGVPASLTGVGFVADPVGATNGSGRYPISGDKYFETGADLQSSSFNVSFTTPVAGFGFYGIDIGDLPGVLTLRVTRKSGSTQSFDLGGANAIGGGVLFFGLIETDLNSNNWVSSLDFLAQNSDPLRGDYFGIDDFAVGDVAPVPEPTSLLLLGTGVVAAVAARRRRSKKSAE